MTAFFQTRLRPRRSPRNTFDVCPLRAITVLTMLVITVGSRPRNILRLRTNWASWCSPNSQPPILGFGHDTRGEKFVAEQWEAVIRLYRNHPSIVTWCMGNELYKSFDAAPQLYQRAKQIDRPGSSSIRTDAI